MKPALAALLLAALAACAGTTPRAGLGIGVGGGDVQLSPSLSITGRYGGIVVYH